MYWIMTTPAVPLTLAYFAQAQFSLSYRVKIARDSSSAVYLCYRENIRLTFYELLMLVPTLVRTVHVVVLYVKLMGALYLMS